MTPHVTILRRPTWTSHPHYKNLTTSQAVVRYHGITVPDCEIYHKRHPLGYVHQNTLTIYTAYAWDGMTLYREKEDTHNTKGNKLDSLLHDFHYQTGLIPRRAADRILAHMAKQHDPLHWAIYLGVRLGGWRFYAKDKDIRIIREDQDPDHDTHSDLTYSEA